MFRNHGEREVHRPARGFFATLAFGLCSVVVVGIVCGTGLGFYGLKIADSKSDNLVEFAREVVGNIPEIAAALPPIVGDVFSDERRPDYVDQLQLTAHMPEFGTKRRGRCPIIEVKNNGSEVVSMLSLHVVVRNEDGQPIADFNEWAATPIAADDEWRGPLLPDSKRVFTANSYWISSKSDRPNLTVDVEVTDVRVWTPIERQNAVNVMTSDDAETSVITVLARE